MYVGGCQMNIHWDLEDATIAIVQIRGSNSPETMCANGFCLRVHEINAKLMQKTFDKNPITLLTNVTHV